MSHWWPQQPEFRSGGLAICGALREQLDDSRKFDTVGQLKQAVVLEWHALPRAKFIDHSIGKQRHRLQFLCRSVRHIEDTFPLSLL